MKSHKHKRFSLFHLGYTVKRFLAFFIVTLVYLGFYNYVTIVFPDLADWMILLLHLIYFIMFFFEII